MEFNLADLWEHVVDAVPDREALVFGTHRLTFRQADERANRLAHFLQEQGVGPGDHVAVYLRNRPEYVEAMFAALKLRAVPINVNYRYVADELLYLLDDADTKAVVVQEEFLSLVEEVRGSLTRKGTIIVVDDAATDRHRSTDHFAYEAALRGSVSTRDFERRSADDLYIVYTGGTTGMPKGVLWRSEDIFFAGIGGGNPGGDPITRPEDITAHLDRPIRCLPACPLMHGTANWFAMRTLFGGGAVILSPDRQFDPLGIWRLIARYRVDFLVIVGDAFGRPLVDALDHLEGQIDVSCLRWVLSSGATLSASVKEEWLQRMPHLRIIDGFGSSETGAQGQSVTVAGRKPAARSRFELNDDVQVFDDDNRVAAVGVVGRLARTGHIPLGYHNDTIKTATTFPVIGGKRWSIPGDFAIRADDGTITVLGRGSVCINTGGEKVFPEEVEAALKSHPDVVDALVVGVPDARWGERVVAVVEASPGTKPSLQALNESVREHVAGYKVPRDVVLVDTVVRSPSGKPDYVWARSLALRESNVAQ